MTREVSIKPGRLACLPLSFLAEQELVDTYIRENDGGAGYYDVMTSALWVYQLHSYRGLVRLYFGETVAAQVMQQQQAIFDSEQAGAGKAIGDALRMIDLALEALARQGGMSQPASTEHCVALALLFGLPESPDYLPVAQRTDRQAHRTPGIDDILARLLSQARQELVTAFMPLFNDAKLA